MKFEYTQVSNFDGAFRGMRNALESWDKSDSEYKYENIRDSTGTYIIGKNDLILAQKLIKAGSDHRKFMREIMISVDITAPLYWWKEWDTYKIGTVANSTSTMHKLATTPITKECFEIMPDFEIENESIGIRDCWINIISDCEMLRKKYIQTKDKRYWLALIQLLPEAWLQKRTCTLNYEVIRNMYCSRRNHKLDCWSSDFVNWVNNLPNAKELIINE